MLGKMDANALVGYIPDILLYLAVFIVSGILVYNGLKLFSSKKKIGVLLIILGVLIPSIMAGIRYGVGGDFFSYLKMYNNVVSGKKMYFRSIEPLSTLIITLSGYLHSSFSMFFVFNLITNACFLMAFIKVFKGDAKRSSIAYLFYLCILYSATLFVIRNMAAIAVLTLAFSYLLREWSKKSIIKAILLIIVAFLFHKTAILALVFIPAFWLAKKNSGKKMLIFKKILPIIYLAIAALLPAIYAVAKTFINLGDYTRYLRRFGNVFSMPIANMIMIVPIILAIIYLYKQRKASDEKELKELLYCSSFYIPLSVVVGWLTLVGANALSRLSFLLEPIIICLMAQLIISASKMTRIWKTAIIVCIVGVVGLMLVRNLSWSVSLPYQTIFQEASYATKN